MALITVAARSELIALYTAMFKAAPGANNLTDMVAAYEAGGTTSSIAKTLAAKADFATVYPGFTTAAEFAASLVSNLLGSDVTAAITTWSTDYVVGLLNSGKTRADAIVTAVVALRATTNTGFTVAQAALANKVDVASYYSMTQGQSSTSLQVLQGVIAGVTSVAATTTAAKTAVDTTTVSASSQTFRLTTDIDTFTGSVGNDKFSATPVDALDTFTALDSLDGGAGNDTLTVAAAGVLTIPAGSTVKNIETATLASSTTVTGDVSGWTGLTQLNVVAGTGSAITAAATTNVTEAASVNNASIIGGKDVTVTHSAAGAVTVDQAAGAVKVTSTIAGVAGAYNAAAVGTVSVLQSLLGAGGAVTVNAKGNVTVTGGTSLNVSIDDNSAYATRKANISALTSAKLLSSTATLQAAAQLVVDGVTAMAAAVAAADTIIGNATATATALRGGFITAAEKLAIDTAFITAFNAVGGTAVLARAAALPSVTAAATVAATAFITAGITGATNLATKTAAQALATADALAGTSGIAHLVSAITNTALASATVKGNNTSTVTITDGSVGLNQLTTVTLDNAGVAALTGSALTNVSVSNAIGGTQAVTVTNTTINHTQNLTLSNVGTDSSIAPTAWVFADANAATVNVVSNGTANIVTLTAGAATAVNLTGAGKFTASGLSTGLNAAAVITATGSSGTNTVTIAPGQSYLGGSGTDIVTTGATLQTVAVSGGAGAADKLIVTNVANILLNTVGTGSALFTGFEILEANDDDPIDLSTTLTGNTFTSIIFRPTAGGTVADGSISGLNATQANAVTISRAPNATGYTLGVTGATNVGQLDTVTVTTGVALGDLDIAGVETLNITPTGSTSFNFGSAPALNALNITGGSSAVLIESSGVALNPNTIIDASKGTGKTMINMLGSTANGAKLVGSATANNVLTSAAALASVLVGGAGNDILRGSTQADIISAGNGNNTVLAGNGANTVTLGNGINVVTGGTGVDTITVGTGSNWITPVSGLDVITLGAHGVGVTDVINLGIRANSVGVANVKTVNGFVSGADKINLVGGGGAGDVLTGVTLTAAASTAAVMLAPVTNTTSVATLAEVNAGLLVSLPGGGNEFLGSAGAAGAGQIVARQVIFTTGAAAGTYLVINDSTAGFVAADDLVMKLSGTVAAGDFTVGAAAWSVTPSLAFTATVGIDTFVGGDAADTFSASWGGSTAAAINAQSTFGTAAGDTYAGGAGTDTLTIGTVSEGITGQAITLVDLDFDNITAIENLVVNASAAVSVTVANAEFTLNGFTSLTTNVSSTAAIVRANVIAGGGLTAATTLVATNNNAGTIAITGGSDNDTITATVGVAANDQAGVDASVGSGTITITAGDGDDVITLTSLGGTRTGVATIVFAATAAANGSDTITGFIAALDIINWVQGAAEADAAAAFTTTADTIYQLGGLAAGSADTAAAVAAAFNLAATVTADAADTTAWIAISDNNSTSIWAWVDIGGVADEVNAAELTLVGTFSTAMTTAQLTAAITII